MKRGKPANKETPNKSANATPKLNGQAKRGGSKNVTMSRCTVKKGLKTETATAVNDDRQCGVDATSKMNNSDVQLQQQLGGVDKLPSVDTPEAANVSATRLREIVRRLETGQVDNTTLINNLQYAADVLENVYKVENMRISTIDDDNDDVLSEAETQSIPTMVRDWLTMTFTRSMSNLHLRQDRLRFRSVANAIRAGIVVDRFQIYRRMSSTVALHVPPDVLISLKNVDDWSFDVFQVNETGDGHALKYIGYELLQKYNLINKFKINTQTLDSFLTRLEQGYSKFGNPYHNLVHAADVTQTTHHLFSQSGLVLWLTDLEVLAVLLSALMHDFEHTGTTNAYHVNICSDVAMTYNDKAVLENFHASTVFRILKEENYNVLANLKKEEYRELRALVIEIVLATDMSFHFQQVKNMKNLLLMPENIDKSKALSLLVHCADISHPAKNWNLHSRWTDLLVEEFFKQGVAKTCHDKNAISKWQSFQGDKEAELDLPISPLCDRKNTMISESQIGFIDFIVDPSFQVMGDMLDKILAPMQQKRSDDDDDDDDRTALRKVSRATNTGSVDSLKSSESVTDGEVLEVKRYWVECLRDNKVHWTERAVRDAELRAAAAAIEAAKVEAEEIVNLTSSQNDIQAASLPLPGETNNDVETEKDMPDTISVSLQTSPQLAVVSPEAQRTDSRATAVTRSPAESTPTPTAEQSAAVGSRPPSSASVGGKRSTEPQRNSTGQLQSAVGGDTAAE